MARHGFIHSKFEIKLLVLYIMARVAAPIEFATITDLVLCDDGVDYFIFAESLAEMVTSEHLALEDGRYAITDKGRRDGTVYEGDLPFTVKRKCNNNLAPINTALRRDAQVHATAKPRDDGGVDVWLALDDETGNLLSISLFSPNKEQADLLCENFKTRPERIFNEVLEALLAKEGDEKKTTTPEPEDAQEQAEQEEQEEQETE